jgi:hypothetical protein
VTLEIMKVERRLIEHNVKLQLSEAARNYLGDKGYSPEYGARPLRRLVQNEVEDKLSDKLLAGELSDNIRVSIDFVDEKLTFGVIEQIQGDVENVEIKPIEPVGDGGTARPPRGGTSAGGGQGMLSSMRS